MKIINYIILPLFFCTTLNYHLTSCMELPQEQIEQKINIIKGFAQKNKEKLEQYILNKCNADRDAEIQIIKNKLAHIQEQIDAEYKLAFATIQKKYTVDYDFYTYIQNIANNTPIYNEKNENIKKKNVQKATIFNIQKDDTMPLDILFMLKKYLNQNNISPCLIRFGYKKNIDHSCCVTSANLSSIDEHHGLHIKITTCGYITINKRLFKKLSPSAKEGFCIAILNEFKHMVNSSIFFLMVDAMQPITINHDPFITYTDAIEKLSLLTQALKKRKSARLLTIFLSEIYDPKIADDHYKKLFKIDRLHSILSWLKKHTV